MPQVNLEQCSQHVLIDKSPYSTVPGAKYGSFVNFCSSGIVFSTIVPQSNLQTIGHGFTTVCVLVLCNLIKKSKVPTQLSITSPVVTLYFVCSSLPGITITISIGQSRAESRSADMLTVLQYFSQSAYCRLQQEGEPLHTTEKKKGQMAKAQHPSLFLFLFGRPRRSLIARMHDLSFRLDADGLPLRLAGAMTLLCHALTPCPTLTQDSGQTRLLLY